MTVAMTARVRAGAVANASSSSRARVGRRNAVTSLVGDLSKSSAFDETPRRTRFPAGPPDRFSSIARGGSEAVSSATSPSSPRGACVFVSDDTAILPDGKKMTFVSRPDVQFLYDEIFAERCYLRHGLTIRKDSTVIDVGGNIGMFALCASELASEGEVYVLEPVPGTFEALRRNLLENRPRGEGSGGSAATTCLDATDAVRALHSGRVDLEETPATPRTGCRVVAYNVGVSDGVERTATFTIYPRAVGWSSMKPDPRETAENVRLFVHRKLSRGRGRGRGSRGKDQDATTFSTTTKTTKTTNERSSLSALHPLASAGRRILRFAEAELEPEPELDAEPERETGTAAARGVSVFTRIARFLARGLFDSITRLVTAYLLGGRSERVCPLATVSDVIRSNGLDRANGYAVDFLKIDVERAELLTLRGVEQSHRGLIRQIALEVHDDGGGGGDSGVRAVMDLLTAPLRGGGEGNLSGAAEAFGFGFDREKVIAEQPEDLIGGTLWNVYARR